MRYVAIPVYKIDELSDTQRTAALDNLRYATVDDMLGEYLKILQEEYEYRTSDEGVLEMIEANEFEFTADGEIFNKDRLLAVDDDEEPEDDPFFSASRN